MSKKIDKSNGLSTEAKKLLERLRAEWNITDSAGETAAWAAAQAWDRLQQARRIIDAEGLMTKDRFGQPKLHPATQVEREARQGLLAALKAMNLDLESLETEDDAKKA